MVTQSYPMHQSCTWLLSEASTSSSLHLSNTCLSLGAMSELSSVLVINVNGQQTFFLSEKILSSYSVKWKDYLISEYKQEQEPERGSVWGPNLIHHVVDIHEFPGGADGFELVCRFCYNGGKLRLDASNVCLLHCCAITLGMSDDVSVCNLFEQSESFLETMFYWSWDDVLASLSSCAAFFGHAVSARIVEKLICALFMKIAQNSDTSGIRNCGSSSSSSPITPAISPNQGNWPSPGKQWWFDDVATLPPLIIQTVVKNLSAFGSDNDSLILTRFLLFYLKKSTRDVTGNRRSDYQGLAETAVHGVITAGKSSFSCRGLFRVLKTVVGFGLSKDCQAKLENMIGETLDQATLDDLLVSSCHSKGTTYDINLFIRLTRIFVASHDVSSHKMKKIGALLDRFLVEISPDQKLQVSKFLGVAEVLPDSARDCYDGLYRAIDIYLESHPTLSFKNRTKICRCLDYKKLTFEACKDLAKNPRIPPGVAVEALISQKSILSSKDETIASYGRSTPSNHTQMVPYEEDGHRDTEIISRENEDMKVNIERMQWKVVELEKACREMKNQMSRMVRNNNSMASPSSRALPRLC